MSTATKERTTDVGRLAAACDSLLEVKEELAAVVAAARGVEEPNEAKGISTIVDRLRRQVSENLENVQGVQSRLRENGASPPESSGTLTLSEEEVSALNVLIAAVGLASDGTLGTMTKLVCQEITPRPIRRILRKVLIEAAPALEKIEEASPYRGEDLLATRGEALKELVLEATEGMES